MLVLLLAGPANTALAEPDEHEVRSKLEKLQGDIQRIGQEISADSARRNNLQQELREAELKLGRLQNEMSTNQRALAASEEELTGLQQQRGELERARDAQQARIALELETAWQLGQQGQVKVLPATAA